MTRCKVVCQSVTKRLGYGGAPFLFEAELTPVHRDSPENEDFFASTPGGRINLATIRDDHFVPGKTYYVDFTEAES